MEPVQLAKLARESLIAALNAIQSSEDAPDELFDAAEPIAQTITILRKIERSGGALLDGRDVALKNVRKLLADVQNIDSGHPAADEVLEAIAASLSKVNALARWKGPGQQSVPPMYGSVPPTQASVPPAQSSVPPPPAAIPRAAPVPVIPHDPTPTTVPRPAAAVHHEEPRHALDARVVHTAQPVVQAKPQPIPQPVAAPQPVLQPKPVESKPPPAPQPVVQAKPQPVPQPVAAPQPVLQPKPVESKPPPAPQPAPQPVVQAKPVESKPPPAPQPAPQPVVQAKPVESKPPPAPQPAPQPVVQAKPVESKPPPAPQPAPQPVVQAKPVESKPPPAPQPAAAPPSISQAKPVDSKPQAAPTPGSIPPPPQKKLPPPPAPPGVRTLDVSLGVRSVSNFYRGLSGNDVIDHGGVFVETYQIPKIGTQFQLHVHMPGDYEFYALATVMWTRETGGSSEPGFGARFTQIGNDGRQLVYRYSRIREPMFYDDL